MSLFMNCHVIVTGAAQGIGKFLSLGYAAQGAVVYAIDKNQDKLTELQNEADEKGLLITTIAANLAKAEEIEACYKRISSLTSQVHILINNAGYGIWKSPLELSVEEWDDVINTNLRGSFLCAKHVTPLMQTAGWGSIVNISSTRALMSEPNSEAYAASKGGILSLTHALALSLGNYNITVNTISPGWIETGDYEQLRRVDHLQHPAGRVGKPDDIVQACYYLTSQQNRFVTGTQLVVDGGMTRKMIYEP